MPDPVHMEPENVREGTVLIDWTTRSFYYRDQGATVIRVHFPDAAQRRREARRLTQRESPRKPRGPRAQLDAFRYCCAIAVAQSITVSSGNPTSWFGASDEFLNRLSPELGGSLSPGSRGTYWSLFAYQNRNFTEVTALTRSGPQPAFDALGLFNPKFHYGFGSWIDRGPAGREIWAITFLAPRETAAERELESFKQEVTSLFSGTQERPSLSVNSLLEAERREFHARVRPFAPVFRAHEFFGGRVNELEKLNHFVTDGPGSYFFVTGPSGVGKTALLARWVQHLDHDRFYCIPHFLTPFVNHGTEERSLLESVCSQLMTVHGVRQSLPHDMHSLRDLFWVLLHRPPGSERQIVLLLEGLDEAMPSWSPGFGLFPDDIATGIRIVVSAREIAGKDWVHDLGLRLPDDCLLHLGTLAADDIEDAFRRMEPSPDEQSIGPLSERVLAISGGDPFYVHDLLRDLKSSDFSIDQLEDYPLSANEYLVHWWKSGCCACGARAFADLMSYLALARQPLRRDVLVRLSDTDAVDAANYRILMDAASRYLVGNGAAGYQLSHDRIIAFIRKEMEHELATFRQRFADFSLRWAEFPPGPAREYAVRWGPKHLLAASRWNALGELLTQLPFLEAKAESGLIFELADDLAEAVETMPEERPDRYFLTLLAEALHDDTGFIERHPSTLFQCLWNRCWWYDSPESARHYVMPEEGWPKDTTPWLRDDPKIHTLLEGWRAGKEPQGRVWVRSLRPPHTPLASGATAMFRDHQQDVRGVAVSHDGQYLATISSDHVAILRNLLRGSEHVSLPWPARLSAWAPTDTRLLVVHGDGQLVVCTPASLRNSQVIGESDECIRSIAWSPNGALVASGTSEGAILLRHAGDGTQRFSSLYPDECVLALAFSSDGQFLLAAFPKKIRVIDIATQQVLQTLDAHEGSKLTNVAFSPDRQHIATLSDLNVHVYRWDADGTFGAASGFYTPGGAGSMAFSRDGALLAIGSYEGIVHVNDVATKKERTLLRGHEGRVTCLAFSPVRDELVSGSTDHSVRVWRPLTGLVERYRKDHWTRVESLAATRGGAYAASADDSVWIWDAETGEAACRLSPNKLISQRGGVNCLDVSADDTRVITGTRNGRVDVWDMRSGAQLARLRVAYGANSVQGYLNGRRVIVGSMTDTSVSVFCVAPQQLLLELGSDDNRAVSCALSPGGYKLAVGMHNGNIHIVDAWRGIELGVLTGHTTRVWRVVFSSDGQRLASKADDGSKRIWDLKSGACAPGDGVAGEDWPDSWLDCWQDDFMGDADELGLRAWEVASGHRFGHTGGAKDDSVHVRRDAHECALRIGPEERECAWIPGRFDGLKPIGRARRKWVGIADKFVDLFAIEGLDCSRIHGSGTESHVMEVHKILNDGSAWARLPDREELIASVESADSSAIGPADEECCAACQRKLDLDTVLIADSRFCTTCVEMAFEEAAFSEDVSNWSDERVRAALLPSATIVDKLAALWQCQALLRRYASGTEHWRQTTLSSLVHNLAYVRRHAMAPLVRALAVQACAAFGEDMLPILRSCDAQEPWQLVVNIGLVATRISEYGSDVRKFVEGAAQDTRPQVRFYVPMMVCECDRSSTWVRNIVERLAEDADASVRKAARSLIEFWEPPPGLFH